MKQREPSKLEMQVLSVLWERGPSTVRAVMAALPDGKARAYTTVLTVMQVMEKKGLVVHSNQGNAHVYAPKATRERTVGAVMKTLVRNLFGGSPAAVMQHLLAENEVTPLELARLRQVIHDHEASTNSCSKPKAS